MKNKREKLKEYYWQLNHRYNINGEIERYCNSCEEWMLENETNFYYKNKYNVELEFSSECKICARKRSLKDRANNLEKQKENQRAWKQRNKEIEAEKDKTWRENNPGYMYQYGKIYYANNPDKYKIYNQKHRVHDITSSEEKALLKVFNHQCSYCGMTEEENKKKFNQKLHNDHVNDEGYNDLRNDVPACTKCNTSKHTSVLDTWYPKQKFYDVNKYNKIIWWTTEGYKDYIENKPPYKIIRKRNEDNRTYHFQLWTVDEKRNMIECIDIKSKKKELDLTLIHNLS